MKPFRINNHSIGPGLKTYLIAELSANHGQDFKQAKNLIYAAKEAGADAVKLQTYTADTLTIACDKEPFRIRGGTIWDGQTLYDLYGQAYTPWEWQPELKKIADELEMDLFSSPFDGTSVAFLERMSVPAYKVASFEIIDIPLIQTIARTGKPIIFSTGMADYFEIKDATEAALAAGAREMALLKCTSSYPAPPETMNLLGIQKLVDQFDLPVGLSDHTLGIAAPIAAVALGACLIEKHFCLSRSIKGPDSTFSLEPAEFKQMVDAIRVTELAMGEKKFGPSQVEEKSRVFRRSLFIVQNVKKGEPFTQHNVRSIRPGYGIAPKFVTDVLGQPALCDIERGTPLQWEHFIVKR